MNLDRTVKWIDKTGKLSGIQTEEISSVKLYSTPAEFWNTGFSFRAIKKLPRNFSRFLVFLHTLRKYERRKKIVQVVQNPQRSKKNKRLHETITYRWQYPQHPRQSFLRSLLVLRQLKYPVQDQNIGTRSQKNGKNGVHILASGANHQPRPPHPKPHSQHE